MGTPRRRRARPLLGMEVYRFRRVQPPELQGIPAEGEGGFPDLLFPTDRAWLVSLLWDDSWRSIGTSEATADRLELQRRPSTGSALQPTSQRPAAPPNDTPSNPTPPRISATRRPSRVLTRHGTVPAEKSGGTVPLCPFVPQPCSGRSAHATIARTEPRSAGAPPWRSPSPKEFVDDEGCEFSVVPSGPDDVPAERVDTNTWQMWAIAALPLANLPLNLIPAVNAFSATTTLTGAGTPVLILNLAISVALITIEVLLAVLDQRGADPTWSDEPDAPGVGDPRHRLRHWAVLVVCRRVRGSLLPLWAWVAATVISYLLLNLPY